MKQKIDIAEQKQIAYFYLNRYAVPTKNINPLCSCAKVAKWITDKSGVKITPDAVDLICKDLQVKRQEISHNFKLYGLTLK